MDKQALIDQTQKTLTPLETENIVKFVQNFTFLTLLEHPWLLAVLLVLVFYAVIKRSLFMILFLFSFFSIMLLVRYTIPSEGEITLKSLLPLLGGGVGIGSVLIYFIFVRSE